MQKILRLPESLQEILESVEGKNLDEKLIQLIRNDLRRRFYLCSERIMEFETKYGMQFEEFVVKWKADKIPNRYSHETERDYMEWESLIDEHEMLLLQLRKLKGKFPSIP